MSTLHRHSAPARQQRLFLLFAVGAERYALDVREVAEVLPLRRLRPVPATPAWVAGLLAHRGTLLPVLDISQLLGGQPATQRTSTRLVLVHYQPRDSTERHLLGLILERAAETLRCAPEEFRAYGLDTPDAPYLGPVYQDARGLVQWLRVADLLNAEARALLFPPERTA
ncbi:chemotaxis protein CheW [Pseudomonas sp. SO81]|uniref:chemotaxis protein CheW n=1 Tax=Pseudomonas sp. SO81 TaxID=2983246 RepID=UPI0025A4BFE8|nr:chemotaxis protein CheW [Pseudomonas sp. SO81]WJN59956.1 CheW domain protein WspB [Pseudomonas sp. SO81]